MKTMFCFLKNGKDEKLSSTQKKYLLAIYKLGINGNSVKSKDIAEFLGVQKSSVSKMLDFLVEDAWIEKEYYGKVNLTPDGAKKANLFYTDYMLLYSCFLNMFNVNKNFAARDALVCTCDCSREVKEGIISILLKQ